VREAGRLIGVWLLDHVIISSDRHFSLLDTGLIAG
jgi:DNA repair protein RadC